MILRRPKLAVAIKSSTTAIPSIHQCLRHAHNTRLLTRPIPPPTPFVPDVPTFLKLIGRQLSAHSSKIRTWEALFTMTSTQMREIGVEPARQRKYLLRWRERFRQGRYGIGGDMIDVRDGVAEMKLFEVPVPEEWRKTNPSVDVATVTRTPGMRRVAINVPVGSNLPSVPLQQAKPVEGVKVRGVNRIEGPHVYMLKDSAGTKAKIEVKEGLWEEKRGNKVDGGERRKAEVRSKRRAEERKKARS